MDNACDIEFQGVHRIGAKRPDSPRPSLPVSFAFPIERTYLDKDDLDERWS